MAEPPVIIAKKGAFAVDAETSTAASVGPGASASGMSNITFVQAGGPCPMSGLSVPGEEFTAGRARTPREIVDAINAVRGKDPGGLPLRDLCEALGLSQAEIYEVTGSPASQRLHAVLNRALCGVSSLMDEPGGSARSDATLARGALSILSHEMQKRLSAVHDFRANQERFLTSESAPAALGIEGPASREYAGRRLGVEEKVMRDLASSWAVDPDEFVRLERARERIARGVSELPLEEALKARVGEIERNTRGNLCAYVRGCFPGRDPGTVTHGQLCVQVSEDYDFVLRVNTVSDAPGRTNAIQNLLALKFDMERDGRDITHATRLATAILTRGAEEVAGSKEAREFLLGKLELVLRKDNPYDMAGEHRAELDRAVLGLKSIEQAGRIGERLGQLEGVKESGVGPMERVGLRRRVEALRTELAQSRYSGADQIRPWSKLTDEPLEKRIDSLAKRFEPLPEPAPAVRPPPESWRSRLSGLVGMFAFWRSPSSGPAA